MTNRLKIFFFPYNLSVHKKTNESDINLHALMKLSIKLHRKG